MLTARVKNSLSSFSFFSLSSSTISSSDESEKMLWASVSEITNFCINNLGGRVAERLVCHPIVQLLDHVCKGNCFFRFTCEI